MKFLSLALLAFLGTLSAQTAQPQAAQPALPDLPDQTTVAVLDDGTRITMADFKKIFAVLPAQNQQVILRDRKAFLQQWAFMRKLALMAEKQKLDQESPTKEALEYYRYMLLSQAKLNDAVNSTVVDAADVVKFYDLNKEKFKQVRVKAIYIAFSSEAASSQAPGSKKRLTEAEAKAKAVKLVAQIRGGADFIKLVKENSDDETSRAKDGDFATLRPTDNIPDAIRTAVFALKAGEVSEPVRQPNGFYVLRAEDVTSRALSQVRDEIYSEIKNQRYREWLDKASRETKVEFPTPAFLAEPASGNPAPPNSK